MKRGDAAIATREFRVALDRRPERQGLRALRPRRKLSARGQGRRRQAGSAGRARDRADFERAQDLLLKAVEKDGSAT